MEKKTYEKISDIWSKCKRKEGKCPKVIPSVYYAETENNDIYYVAKDFSTIVFLVHIHENKPYTYVIPKKYLDVIYTDDMKKYFIKKPSKLDLVSCSNNQIDDFDLFVVKNIISKLK